MVELHSLKCKHPIVAKRVVKPNKAYTEITYTYLVGKQSLCLFLNSTATDNGRYV